MNNGVEIGAGRADVIEWGISRSYLRAPISIAASGAQFEVLTGMPMGAIFYTLNPDGVFADAFGVD